jgi:hypothetical protein
MTKPVLLQVMKLVKTVGKSQRKPYSPSVFS